LRFSLRGLFALVTGCALFAVGYTYLNRNPLVQMFGGSEGFNVVRSPANVEIYRLGDLPESIAIEDARPTDYPITAGPVSLSAPFGEELFDGLLLEDQSHWNEPAACGFPVYGVKLSFSRGERRVDVFVCFKCDYLDVSVDGVRTGGEYFQSARGPLLRAAKSSFPEDEILQSLEERH
jgi:hypothetical protein